MMHFPIGLVPFDKNCIMWTQKSNLDIVSKLVGVLIPSDSLMKIISKSTGNLNSVHTLPFDFTCAADAESSGN
jgi:hypothetical protein